MAPGKKLLGNVDKVFSAFFALGWTFCRVRPPMQKIISFNSIIFGRSVRVCVCVRQMLFGYTGCVQWKWKTTQLVAFAENVSHRARCDKSGLAVFVL